MLCCRWIAGWRSCVLFLCSACCYGSSGLVLRTPEHHLAQYNYILLQDWEWWAQLLWGCQASQTYVYWKKMYVCTTNNTVLFGYIQRVVETVGWQHTLDHLTWLAQYMGAWCSVWVITQSCVEETYTCGHIPPHSSGHLPHCGWMSITALSHSPTSHSTTSTW